MRIEEHEIFKEAGTISNPSPIMRQMPSAIPSSFSLPQEEKENDRKNNFFVTALPSAIIGAIIGGAVGKSQAAKRSLPVVPMEQNQSRTHNNSFGKKNYYEQMKHLADNLKIIFTPLSIVFIVKDGAREITLDTIEVDEMNDDMKNAWKNRDSAYFRSMLFNKMNSEIQFAEQAFAKKIVERQMGLNNSLNKNASTSDVDFDDLTDVELCHYASLTENFFASETSVTEKVATYIFDSLDDAVEYTIAEARLDRPFDKYAGAVGDVLQSVKFGNIKDTLFGKDKYMNPGFLNGNLKVGFFPDRVIFSVDGKLISTLLVTSMNEEGFDNFQKRNIDFFKNYFKQSVKKGMARLNANGQLSTGQEKTAAEDAITMSDIFVRNDISPIVYFLLLTSKYGHEWVNFDNTALISIIEKDFYLTRSIGDIPLNKIYSVKVANISDTIYESRHAFEKVIRSVNNKPIDFFVRENTDLNLEDFVFGLDIINRVTPYDNIYDNFSPEVYDYMVKVLANREIYAWTVNVTGTEEENQFITMLNYSLLTELNKKFTALLTNEKEISDISKGNQFILEMTLELYPQVLAQSNQYPDSDVGIICRNILASNGISNEYAEIITRQIVRNVVLDRQLDVREENLKQVLAQLGLYREGGVNNE